MPVPKTILSVAALCLICFLLTSCALPFSFQKSNGTVPETVPETDPQTVPDTIVETLIETITETVPAVPPETVPETQWIPHPETLPPETGLPETRRVETDSPATETEMSMIPVIAPGEGVLLSVAHIEQTEELPNACESIAAVMVANYLGFPITPEEFIDNYLPCGELIYDKMNDLWYGPDPAVAYGGDPRSLYKGFGCYAPVIERAMNRYLPDNYRAETIYGKTLEDLTAYLDEGIPVAVWGTVSMNPVIYDLRWYSYDGTHRYLYPSTEHCMVFVGYDKESYYFLDSLFAPYPMSYPKDEAENVFALLGSQALVIIEK